MNWFITLPVFRWGPWDRSLSIVLWTSRWWAWVFWRWELSAEFGHCQCLYYRSEQLVAGALRILYKRHRIGWTCLDCDSLAGNLRRSGSSACAYCCSWGRIWFRLCPRIAPCHLHSWLLSCLSSCCRRGPWMYDSRCCNLKIYVEKKN